MNYVYREMKFKCEVKTFIAASQLGMLSAFAADETSVAFVLVLLPYAPDATTCKLDFLYLPRVDPFLSCFSSALKRDLAWLRQFRVIR